MGNLSKHVAQTVLVERYAHSIKFPLSRVEEKKKVCNWYIRTTGVHVYRPLKARMVCTGHKTQCLMGLVYGLNKNFIAHQELHYHDNVAVVFSSTMANFKIKWPLFCKRDQNILFTIWPDLCKFRMWYTWAIFLCPFLQHETVNKLKFSIGKRIEPFVCVFAS